VFIAANSWLFVKLVAPAGVLGYVSVVVGENKALEIARSLLQFPAGDILLHRSEMLQRWLARLTGYFVSWTAFCIAFGGISLSHSPNCGRIYPICFRFFCRGSQVHSSVPETLLAALLSPGRSVNLIIAVHAFLGMASGAGSPESLHLPSRRVCDLGPGITCFVSLRTRNTIFSLGQLPRVAGHLSQ